jgi:NDP-sugar pyrophosphorylase family protein
MAGGEGARLLPFTNILPKSLIPIDGKPVIELIIDRFKQCGCSEFYLSVNYKANILQAYFSNYKEKYKIKYIQEDKPLGTIGSLYMLKNKIKAPFFVSNCDILIEADYYDIFRFHKDNKNKLTLVVSLKHYTIPYGICNIKKSGILKGIKEKPEYDFLVNTGLYLMEPEVLGDIPKKKFYNTTDLIGDYIKGKEKIGVYPVSEKSWLDMGQWEELQSSIQRFRSI